MSRPQTPENVSALEHEHETVAPSSGDKASNSVPAQVIASVPAADGELEPVVTRKELWSYYRMSLRDSPACSCGVIERLPLVYYGGDNGVGPQASGFLMSDFSSPGGSTITHRPYQ